MSEAPEKQTSRLRPLLKASRRWLPHLVVMILLEGVLFGHGHGMLFVVVLQVPLVLFFGAIVVPAWLRERTWTIRGAIAGACLGALTGIGLGIWVGLDEKMPAGLFAFTCTVCVAAFSVQESMTGAVVGAVGHAKWRSLRRKRIMAACRRAREAGATPANCLDLGDLDRIATEPEGFRALDLILLGALKDGVNSLRLESSGNIVRIHREHQGLLTEMLPVPVRAEVLAARIKSYASTAGDQDKEFERGRLRLKARRRQADALVTLDRDDTGYRIELELPLDGALAQESASILADYEKWFVGDPWSAPGSVPMAVRPQRDGALAADVPDTWPSDEQDDALLRLVFPGHRTKNGLLRIGIQAELDGVNVAEGTNRTGFDCLLKVSIGNHLLRLATDHPLISSPGHKWAKAGAFPSNRFFLLHIPAPGAYRVTLRMRHLQPTTSRFAPALCEMSATDLEELMVPVSSDTGPTSTMV